MEENIQINPAINNNFIPQETNIDNKKAMGSFVLSIVSLILSKLIIKLKLLFLYFINILYHIFL